MPKASVSDSNTPPVIIAVAPNGARHQKLDHPGLPISPAELATTSTQCLQAGASMLHLHVRDGDGGHSLRSRHYRPALLAIREAVGQDLLLQVTSESAGVYSAREQIEHIGELAPGFISLAVREFFAEAVFKVEVTNFLRSLLASGTEIQYILHNPTDVRRFRALVGEGAIPGSRHFVLFVLGRYETVAVAAPGRLDDYLTAFENGGPWMACAFGPRSFEVLSEAVVLGGHVRVGFENGWYLPNGAIAPDNASLVSAMATQISATGHSVATVQEAASVIAPDRAEFA